MSKRLLCAAVSFLLFLSNYPIVRGSKTAVSLEPAVTFQLEIDNNMHVFQNQTSYHVLHMEQNTELILCSPLTLKNGTFYFNQSISIYHYRERDLMGKVHAEGPFTFEYER